MNLKAFTAWIAVVAAVTAAVQHGIATRGALVAAFAASLILSDTAFVEE